MLNNHINYMFNTLKIVIKLHNVVDNEPCQEFVVQLKAIHHYSDVHICRSWGPPTLNKIKYLRL